MTRIEEMQLEIIELLIDNGGYWTGGDAEVLVSLASALTGTEQKVGSNAYKRTSLAILMLERIGFVQVERRYTDEAQRANVIERINVT